MLGGDRRPETSARGGGEHPDEGKELMVKRLSTWDVAFRAYRTEPEVPRARVELTYPRRDYRRVQLQVQRRRWWGWQAVTDAYMVGNGQAQAEAQRLLRDWHEQQQGGAG